MVERTDVDISLTDAALFSSVRILCIAFILGSLARLFVRWIKVPSQESVVLLLIGLITGSVVSQFPNELQEYTDIAKTPPKKLLSFFIPLMSFGTAYRMDSHAFYRSFWQIFLLTTSGVFFYTVLVAIIIKTLPTDWDWEIAFMFGAASACTAPRPIADHLNDLGRSKGLVALLQGEWLCSLASTIFIINMSSFIADGFWLGAMVTVYMIFRIFVGPIIGILAGVAVNFIFPLMYGDFAMEMVFTLVCTFVTFTITEQFIRSSGTLAIIAMGVIVAGKRAAMERSDDLALVQFWDMICFLLTTSVYIIAGMVCYLTPDAPTDPAFYIRLVLIYLACLSARFTVVSLQMPLLSRLGYGLTWTEAVVLCWGGLRGTSSLLLAMHVATFEGKPRNQSEIVVSMTCLVLLTLTVNGISFPLVLHIIGQSGPSAMRRIDLEATHHDLAVLRRRRIADMRADRTVPDVSWQLVNEVVRLDETVIIPPSPAPRPPWNCLRCHTGEDAAEADRREALLRLLRLKRVGYWRQYSCGMLSTRALHLLLSAVGLAAERCRPALLLAEIRPAWSAGMALPLFRRWLILLTGILRPTAIAPLPGRRVQTLFFRAAVGPILAWLMIIVMVLSLVPILWNILRHACVKNWLYWTMQILDLALYLFSLAEFFIKVVGLGIRQLATVSGNAILVILLIITTLAKIADFLDMTDVISVCYAREQLFAYWALFMSCHVLRVNILLRIFLEGVPLLLSAVDYLINKSVIFGFEVGSCFVAVQQQVARILPVLHISPDIMRELRLREQEERVFVARTLGVLQSDLPSLPTLVQSGQAIRSLFNSQATSVRGLTERGLLDYTSRNRILAHIRRKRKSARPLLKDLIPRSPLDILLHLPWLESDKQNAGLIIEQVRSTSFQHGEIIQPLLSPGNGLHIILSGVVRITYKPTKEVLRSLDENGELPAMDLFGALNFEDYLEDFVVAGKVLGEMASLTNRPHDASAVAETAVQTFWFPQTLVDSILRNTRTRQLMWLSVGCRIAEELLGQLSADEKCGYRLGKARVDILSEDHSSMMLDVTEDVVLVHGVVLDANGNEKMVAPALLSRRIRQVHAGSGVEAVLLAVPLRCEDLETLHTDNQTRRVTVEGNYRNSGTSESEDE